LPILTAVAAESLPGCGISRVGPAAAL